MAKICFEIEDVFNSIGDMIDCKSKCTGDYDTVGICTPAQALAKKVHKFIEDEIESGEIWNDYVKLRGFNFND